MTRLKIQYVLPYILERVLSLLHQKERTISANETTEEYIEAKQKHHHMKLCK